MSSAIQERWLAAAAFGTLAGLAAYRTAGRWSTLAFDARGVVVAYQIVIVAVLAVITLAALRRPASSEQATHPVGYLATATAVGSLYFVQAPNVSAGSLAVAGDVVALASAAWMLLSVASLGRCFGLLPEARGLVVRGPYRLVRHPIYLGEIGALAGLTVASASFRNGIVLFAFLVAQSIRMRLEEAALERRYPQYAAYAATRPRLIPFPRRWRSPVQVLRAHVF